MENVFEEEIQVNYFTITFSVLRFFGIILRLKYIPLFKNIVMLFEEEIGFFG